MSAKKRAAKRQKRNLAKREQRLVESSLRLLEPRVLAGIDWAAASDAAVSAAAAVRAGVSLTFTQYAARDAQRTHEVVAGHQRIAASLAVRVEDAAAMRALFGEPDHVLLPLPLESEPSD